MPCTVTAIENTVSKQRSFCNRFDPEHRPQALVQYNQSPNCTILGSCSLLHTLAKCLGPLQASPCSTHPRCLGWTSSGHNFISSSAYRSAANRKTKWETQGSDSMMKMLCWLSVLSCCWIMKWTPVQGKDNLTVYKCSSGGLPRNVILTCICRIHTHLEQKTTTFLKAVESFTLT